MQYELYVDSLFLIHFVMNLYILILVNNSTNGSATPGRLLLGAIVGGMGSVFVFFLNGPMVLKLLLLPIVVGISYEFNRLVGRYDNRLTRALSAPGMWLQYLTTNEPDDSMIEVGIEALTQVLPEQEGADKW